MAANYTVYRLNRVQRCGQMNWSMRQGGEGTAYSFLFPSVLPLFAPKLHKSTCGNKSVGLNLYFHKNNVVYFLQRLTLRKVSFLKWLTCQKYKSMPNSCLISLSVHRILISIIKDRLNNCLTCVPELQVLLNRRTKTVGGRGGVQGKRGVKIGDVV